jgi:hypothetical protein
MEIELINETKAMWQILLFIGVAVYWVWLIKYIKK